MAKKILIVDDEPDFILLLKARFESQHYQVISANDGETGLSMARQEFPDLILLDVMMPGLTGYDFVQRVRREGGSLKDTPVIVVSARRSMKDFFNSWEISGFVYKPIEPKELLRTVRGLIGASEAEGGAVPVEAEAPLSGDGKKVVVIGVEDYITDHLIDFFKGQNYEAQKALDENDLMETVGNFKPDFIFCQYWEDPMRLDVTGIHLKLRKNEELQSCTFVSFCSKKVHMEAYKNLSGVQLLPYKDLDELTQKTQDFLKVFLESRA